MNKLTLIALASLMLPAATGQADLIYNLALDGGGSNLAGGTVVPINVVLTESGINDNGQTHTLAGGSGVFGFDIAVDVVGGDATLSNVQFAGYGPAFGNAANVVITPTSLKLNMTSSDFFNSPFKDQMTPAVTIASFDVTFNSADSLITLAGGGSGFPLAFGAGFTTTAIPEARTSFTNASVTGVPEPSSLGSLLVLGVFSLSLRLRRKPSPRHS